MEKYYIKDKFGYNYGTCPQGIDNYKRALKELSKIVRERTSWLNSEERLLKSLYIECPNGVQMRFNTIEEVLIEKGILRERSKFSKKNIGLAKGYLQRLSPNRFGELSYCREVYSCVSPKFQKVIIGDLEIEYSAHIWDIDDEYNWEENWDRCAPYAIEWVINAHPSINGHVVTNKEAKAYIESIFEGLKNEKQ